MFLEFGISILGIYVTLHAIYTSFLLIANFVYKNKPEISSKPETKFAIIIPAHNEEIFLPRLIGSLEKQDYPNELFEIIVVADNCSDRTKEVVSTIGIAILERNDKENIGKGFAIKYALDHLSIDKYDAMFIVDADSVLQSDGLKRLDKVVQDGGTLIQCYNGVVNPDSSWFSRLMNVSRTISNEILEPAKEKLQLSSHLMGNGMCFHKNIIAEHGWDAFSVGEDWEYYAKIIHNGGRIAYAKDVRVYHQESSSLKQATPQRIRWSSGRFEILRKYGFRILFEGFVEKNFLKIDASLPFLLPNPSLAINLTILGLFLSFLLFLTTEARIFLMWYACIMLIYFFIFTAGVLHTKDKLKSFLSLFFAPVFLIWKMGIDILSAMGVGKKKWIRTERRL